MARSLFLDLFAWYQGVVEISFTLLPFAFTLFYPMVHKLPFAFVQVFAKVPFLELEFVLSLTIDKISSLADLQRQKARRAVLPCLEAMIFLHVVYDRRQRLVISQVEAFQHFPMEIPLCLQEAHSGIRFVPNDRI